MASNGSLEDFIVRFEKPTERTGTLQQSLRQLGRKREQLLRFIEAYHKSHMIPQRGSRHKKCSGRGKEHIFSILIYKNEQK